MLIYKRIVCILSVLLLASQVQAKTFEHQQEIDQFYLERNGAPLWISNQKLNENGVTLHEALKNAWNHGLNPDQYNIELDDLDPIQKEILLTQGYIKYARDLSGMRVTPAEISLDQNYWKQRISAKKALDNLAKNETPLKEFLQNLAPQTQTYKRLKSEMIVKPSVQLALNMERLRWLPDQKPDKFIIVNIPSARLWAIENGKAYLEMPVIVGRKDRPTPSFITNAIGVRFNPTWTVPPTIKEKDIWPKLKENPNYLIDKSVEVYDQEQTLDPTIIDWNSITRSDLHKLRMVQLPGKTNPLGRIRILMPNNYSVFLHDTSERGFTDIDRSYSSGCVRLQDPEKVARFILGKDVKPFLKSQQTKDIMSESTIPVHILYHTAWLDSAQNIVYGKDIYGYNMKLEAALRKKNALFPEG